jgi:hypothetical protein
MTARRICLRISGFSDSIVISDHGVRPHMHVLRHYSVEDQLGQSLDNINSHESLACANVALPRMIFRRLDVQLGSARMSRHGIKSGPTVEDFDTIHREVLTSSQHLEIPSNSTRYLHYQQTKMRFDYPVALLLLAMPTAFAAAIPSECRASTAQTHILILRRRRHGRSRQRRGMSTGW